MADPFRCTDAEGAVLHSFICRPSTQGKIACLTAEDFSCPENRKLFSVMQSMYLSKQEVDLVTLGMRLREVCGQDSGQLVNLAAKLSTEFFDTWALDSHIRILRDCRARRSALDIITAAEKELRDSSVETNAALERLRQQLRDAGTADNAWKSMPDVLMDTYTALEKKQSGEEPPMPTGINGLDALTGGFHPGELTIVGARPAVGKSAFGGFAALNAAKNGRKAGICSREMTSAQYGARIIASGSQVDPGRLRSGALDADDWGQVAEAVRRCSGVNVSFLFTARYVEDLRAEAQRKADAGGLDLLVVDYVQLLQTRQRFEKDYVRLGLVSRTLKDMALDLHIAVVGLAQVGRQAGGAMPTLAELRGSGDLEQDADNVIFLHRPAFDADPAVPKEDRGLLPALRQKGLQYIAIQVAKQRQGPVGSVPVIFDPARMTYSDVPRGNRAPEGAGGGGRGEGVGSRQ